ncbi:unnamed protein product [Bursaphelenchus xylophilus]|uniref:(pine wood nematode) hypothetical protein n=1 Tax=Bursaphelenchus xylophilus TaxID=6326 RepID=A0A1I7SLB0_BURXY|nr:unnamed protein product [Bursaphelenchus xylophilus]CAG9129456.1 unnamed protein product [Bursaphelenchus xylophilus]
MGCDVGLGSRSRSKGGEKQQGRHANGTNVVGLRFRASLDQVPGETETRRKFDLKVATRGKKKSKASSTSLSDTASRHGRREWLAGDPRARHATRKLSSDNSQRVLILGASPLRRSSKSSRERDFRTSSVSDCLGSSSDKPFDSLENPREKSRSKSAVDLSRKQRGGRKSKGKDTKKRRKNTEAGSEVRCSVKCSRSCSKTKESNVDSAPKSKKKPKPRREPSHCERMREMLRERCSDQEDSCSLNRTSCQTARETYCLNTQHGKAFREAEIIRLPGAPSPGSSMTPSSFAVRSTTTTPDTGHLVNYKLTANVLILMRDEENPLELVYHFWRGQDLWCDESLYSLIKRISGDLGTKIRKGEEVWRMDMAKKPLESYIKLHLREGRHPLWKYTHKRSDSLSLILDYAHAEKVEEIPNNPLLDYKHALVLWMNPHEE